MRTIRRILSVLAVVSLLVIPCFALAAFDSGSTGEDGALEVTENTTLQLPPDGVFNFTTVHIAEGATLRFKKNEKNTPVTILASGDVLIEGNINVSGSTGGLHTQTGKGGPGGFDGGEGGWYQLRGERGKGIGGGSGGGENTAEHYGGGGGGGAGFRGNGANAQRYRSHVAIGIGGPAYGNPRLIPLIGGSGGGGGGGTTEYRGAAGGGGGGAILIASSTTINVKGGIYAFGGHGARGENFQYGGGGGAGSGGSIRLVANTLAGNGPIDALGGKYQYSGRSHGGNGSGGKIRLEAWNFTRTALTRPVAYVHQYPQGVEPAKVPSLTISSVGGVAVPEIIRGDYSSPDVALPPDTTSPVSVVVSARNIPVGTTVTVNAKPELGNAVRSASGTLSGSNSSSTASVQIEIPAGNACLITVSATFDATVAMGVPDQINGKKIAQVRIASVVGSGSEIFYITDSGKEISATM